MKKNTTKQLIFLDTETTGIETEDRLVQVAYLLDEKMSCELFKAPLSIKVESMAVCHITNKMVEKKEVFKDSPMHKILSDLFESKESILVAHNAKFDAKILEKENVVSQKTICTYKVAQHLDENAIIPSYSLQYLRYYLDLDVEAIAHDAEGDVKVLKALFDRLYAKMFEKMDKEIPFLTEDDVIDSMVNITKKPILIKRFAFGKYKGKKIENVAEIDRGYLNWLLGEKRKEEEKDEDWIHTLNYYLN